MRRALLAVVLLALMLTSGLTACAEIETTTDEGYQPATLSEPDENGVRVVELTQLAAERVGLQTAPVQRANGRLSVPYAALVYDSKGGSWVYEVVDKFTYRRAKVTVASTSGSQVLLSAGPAVGTKVVTQGSTQVYGAEVEMSGKH